MFAYACRILVSTYLQQEVAKWTHEFSCRKKKKKNTSLSASKFTAGEPNTGTSDYGVTQNTLSQSTTHLELRMCLREINNISSKGSRRKHQSSPKNILRHDGGFNTSPRVPAAYLVA